MFDTIYFNESAFVSHYLGVTAFFTHYEISTHLRFAAISPRDFVHFLMANSDGIKKVVFSKTN